MADTITQGGTTITPTAVLGYSADRQSATLVKPIPGSSTPDVTLRPAMKRSGTMSVGFQGASSETNSNNLFNLLTNGTASYTFASTDRTSLNMTFVTVGVVRRELEDASRDAWIVSFDWQEV